MKKNIIAIGLAIFSGVFAYAQSNISGVFLTQMDFENNKLSYTTNDPNAENKFRFHELFGRPFITIKHNGEKIQLFKDDIFAYQKKGRIVRTCNFVSYNFVEKGMIWIYLRDMNVPLGKGIKRERKYYYSVSGKEKIIPLTISNLKNSFPNKHLFHHFLDAHFRSDRDLASYDGFNNKLKVNHLLETTFFQTETTTP
jgi:hypothetical protein